MSRVFTPGIKDPSDDPLVYFSFQPVLCDWYNKGCGRCYPVCGDDAYKRILAASQK